MIATIAGMIGWFVATFATYHVLTRIESFVLRKPADECYVSAALALFAGLGGAVAAQFIVFG